MYHQLNITYKGISNTTFRVFFVHLELLGMSFGLTTTLVVFVNLMNCIFKLYLDWSIIMFIDDIFISLKIRDEHANNLRTISQKIKENKLYMKFSKYKYWINSGTFGSYGI